MRLTESYRRRRAARDEICSTQAYARYTIAIGSPMPDGLYIAAAGKVLRAMGDQVARRHGFKNMADVMPLPTVWCAARYQRQMIASIILFAIVMVACSLWVAK